jgi:dTDP-4-dehydrorhamnose reductase
MILVTGANGQLGRELQRIGINYPTLKFLFTDVAELDITKPDAINSCIETNNIDTIINCAAYTAVDKAEQEPDIARLINAVAVENLAVAANRYHCYLIHISTDYVFSGCGYQPYKEDDPLAPVSSYAQSKAEGEMAMQQAASRGMIIRTSWLYSEYGHNFLKTMMKYGKERGLLKVVYDQIGTPTYAGDLAKAILDILVSKQLPDEVGIYHYSNEGVCSWYDFALAVMEFSGIDCRVIPIETHEYPLPAPRPWYSVFNKGKIKTSFGIEIPYWRDSVKTCVERINKNLS